MASLFSSRWCDGLFIRPLSRYVPAVSYRQVTVGDHLHARGLGPHIANGTDHHSPGPRDPGTEEAGSHGNATSTSANANAGGSSSEASGSMELGPLVLRRGATVSSALQAMAGGRRTHVFVVGESHDNETGNPERAESTAGTISPQTLEGHRSQAGEAAGDREDGIPSDDARDSKVWAPHVLYARDVISLLSPTSSLELGLRWKGFFDNVVGLQSNIERTRIHSNQEALLTIE